ncbi:MAG TPA: elongation factor P [Candidatus Pacearchaeota archaeon]|nr:elongation factor P [Candidatus Pacearchaeota archaeon]
MVSYSELVKGKIIIINDQPYEIVEAQSVFKGRGHSYLQTKLKNLASGAVIAKTIQPREEFEEADIEKKEAKYVYNNKGKFVFSEVDNPSNRFELTVEQIGSASKFLKPDEIVETIVFDDKIINVSLPIKVQLKVIEVTPGVKGDRAASGSKTITLENGTIMNAPLFINEGDVIEINTEREEYVRRINE